MEMVAYGAQGAKRDGYAGDKLANHINIAVHTSSKGKCVKFADHQEFAVLAGSNRECAKFAKYTVRAGSYGKCVK